MLTVLAGVGAVSSAIVYRPALRAFPSAELTALPLGVMTMPWSPAAIALSIALIWVDVSPSVLPAETFRSTPLALASFCAFAFIETKYGLENVLRISATLTCLPLAPLPELLEPQAATPTDAPATTATAARRRRRRLR